MTHDTPGKARSTSRKATSKHRALAVQSTQSRSQKARAVAVSTDADGTSVPRRKKPFVL